MDKELLRVVIILIGVLVILGILIWHFFKSLRDRREAEDYDEAYAENSDDYEEDTDYPAYAASAESRADIDVVDGDALLDDQAIRPSPREMPVDKQALPKLLKFSIVARDDQGFNGEVLFDAFARLGLLYGSVRVFERLDRKRMVDFTVACMSHPGTFPDSRLDEFYCPGIVFYMEPRELEKPLAVFDDFIETIDTLAEELDGVVWDNHRQPLTAETIAAIRQMFV